MDRPRALMDTDAVWDAVDVHRTRVADLLDDLGQAEWDRPSLCDGWTVRDVAAHLTQQESTVRDALSMVVQDPAAMLRGMSTAIHRAARRRAALPPEELVERIRASVGTHRHNVGVTPRDSLMDTLVHSQDIALPLGRSLPLPMDAAAVAVERVWATGWPFHARRTLVGYRLVATDVAWDGGEGPLVQGPVAALLLVATGRAAGTAGLSGPGAAALTEQLAAAR